MEVAVGALLLTLGGCEPELPPFRVAYEGCELYTDVPVAFNDALPREHCAFGDRLTASLGLPIEPVSLRYGLFSDPPGVQGICFDGVGGCGTSGYVFATVPLHLHELVHSTLLSRGFDGPRALQEGAAAVFACSAFPSTEVVPDLAVELLTNTDLFYETAGRYEQVQSFVSFLLDREGEATFMALMERTDDGTGMAALDAVLVDLYGSDAAALLAEWTALGPQPSYRLCRRVYECGAPEWTGDGTLVLERGMSSGSAFGGAIRTLTVEREATLRVDADLVGREVRVISCDRGPDIVPDAGFWSASNDTATIAPGRYAVWITGLLLQDDQSTVEAEVSIAIE